MKFTDQLHNTIDVTHPPRRIISLVPSQTELLYDLGLDEEVVGITKFCIHPDEWYRTKLRVGGTKNVDLEKVRQLHPDLIIGNKEENEKQNILDLKEIAPVWMSDIANLAEALEMISHIGRLTGKQELAEKMVETIRFQFENLALHLPSERKSCLYFMWREPYLTVGQDTFIHAMIEACGFENLQTESRYPEWNFDGDQPDVVLLSSEPFPFTEEHISFFQEHFPKAQILLVDGEYFSWYGSRLRNAPRYFKSVVDQLQ